MKRTINLIALFVASLFITAGVWAQSVKAVIPFNFTVNGSYVPAGTYTISSFPTDHHILEIRESSNSVHIMSVAIDGSRKGKDNVLVFHKYGDQYFLSEIRSENASMELAFPTSKAEQRAKSQTLEAGVPSSDDVVLALY
jgi:hypothetical protein